MKELKSIKDLKLSHNQTPIELDKEIEDDDYLERDVSVGEVDLNQPGSLLDSYLQKLKYLQKHQKLSNVKSSNQKS